MQYCNRYGSGTLPCQAFHRKSGPKKIEYFINLRNMQITDFNRQALTETIQTLLSYAYTEGLGSRDATVMATMKLQNTKKIISHDNIFKRLANKLELEVLDPTQPPQP